MAEVSLQDRGRTARNLEDPATGNNSEADLADVTLSAVPNVAMKQAPHNSTSAVRAVKDMTPEEVKALNEKTRKESAKKYFALRPDAFNNAVAECKTVLDENDGKFLSSWLLTEIDHWDHEREKIVLLTEKMLVLARYNFIGLRCDEAIKIPLIHCDKIQTGRFIYPKNTMMMVTGYADNSPRMQQTGIRVHYAHFEPGFFQNWNPFSHSLPHVTLMDHISAELADADADHMRIKLFLKALIDAVTDARAAVLALESVPSLEVVEEEISLWMYVGLSALVYNQSKLGFCKDRGNIFY